MAYVKTREVTLYVPKEAYEAMVAQMEAGKQYGLVPLASGYTARDFILERLGEGVATFERRLTKAKAPSIIVP